MLGRSKEIVVSGSKNEEEEEAYGKNLGNLIPRRHSDVCRIRSRQSGFCTDVSQCVTANASSLPRPRPERPPRLPPASCVCRSNKCVDSAADLRSDSSKCQTLASWLNSGGARGCVLHGWPPPVHCGHMIPPSLCPGCSRPAVLLVVMEAGGGASCLFNGRDYSLQRD